MRVDFVICVRKSGGTHANNKKVFVDLQRCQPFFGRENEKKKNSHRSLIYLGKNNVFVIGEYKLLKQALKTILAQNLKLC